MWRGIPRLYNECVRSLPDAQTPNVWFLKAHREVDCARFRQSWSTRECASRYERKHMVQVQQNDTVKVHYRGTLQDGTVFDSSFEKEPLEFTIGRNMVIPSFENGVVGMKVGQTHTITIAAQDAYGRYRDDLVINIERSAFPPDADLKPGMVMTVHLGDGDDTNVTIRKLTNEHVILDGNHPLAGKDLTFEIQLVELVRADIRM